MAKDQPKYELHRCPNCGGSDVAIDMGEGKLRCNFCQTLFEGKKANVAGGVKELRGKVIEEGAEDIIPSDEIVVTFKCPSCGAEVVVNAAEQTSASCHWCRHIFSLVDKIPNGAVPDLVLPFKMKKSIAEQKMRSCLTEYKEKIDKTFFDQFNHKDIRSVYFPYFIVDVNAHEIMKGDAEKLADTDKDKKTPPWTIEQHYLTLDYDLLIDDLTVESSAARLNQNRDVNSNNIINAILPFDTENAVAWDANFIRGVASEKRNVNTNKLREVVMLQCGDIARQEVMKKIPDFKRGARWDDEHLDLRGIKWKTAYLPVWLYSYEREGDKRIYYIAVNARTGETVASMPAPKVGERVSTKKRARHVHERETRVEIQNFSIKDTEKGTSLAWLPDMVGRNDNRAIGALATGREDMLLSEKRNYENGKSYEAVNEKQDSESIGDSFWSILGYLIEDGGKTHPLLYLVVMISITVIIILVFGAIIWAANG